ncbi:MAG: type I pullulanase [Erysipelotrichaceae bacterium]|nr:type I pullulanase [Erysipelotrichaceae bacterium]
MRMLSNFEAYIDTYNTVNVYMSKNFYGGKSQIFHLKDSNDNLIPLTIRSKTEPNAYFVHYELAIDMPLNIGEEYFLYDEHCQAVPAVYSHIVKTKEFDDEFFYDGDDLGMEYFPDKTVFKVWAPTAKTVSVCLGQGKEQRVIPMQRQEKGVWEVTVLGDLLFHRYTYLVGMHGKFQETADPYTPFLGTNGLYSVVDDLSLIGVGTEPMKNQTDAIIYEASIRDMSSQSATGIPHPKTFRGFTEENEVTQARRTGFSYIKELGVTHLQLMPVFDFGSTDERYPNIYYNWGYDPMHYRALEGSYCLDPDHPRQRLKEFRKMINSIHTAGMKVNFDLVFNHVWNKGRFGLEVLCPNYYFMMNTHGDFSNGSFCGNDIDTRPSMAKKYFLDTVDMLVDLYDADGFRFDLMGILDIGLLNEIARRTKAKKPDFMIYGEGWNMPSFMPEELRASQNNQYKMPQVGHFSDRFREVIRGSNGELERKGYSSGDTGKLEDAKQVMKASVLENRYDSPAKAINYVECHDNHTLWDKNRMACEGESREQRQKRQILANAMVLFAQGVPFLHAGQEFGRTKQNLGNTYNRSDNYNRIDYFRRNRYEPVVEATRKMIEIRKNHPSLRLASAADIEKHVKTEDLEGQVLVYKTKTEDDELILFFNPTERYFDYSLEKKGRVLLDTGGINEERTHKVYIGPLSVTAVSFE